VLGGRLPVGFEAAQDALAVVVGQELGVVGEVVDEPVAGDADEDGREPLEDEDPGSAGLAAYAAHFGDGGGEQAAETAG
jgi:hypothetical protein